jgi:N-glycosylase/DNA lyase
VKLTLSVELPREEFSGQASFHCGQTFAWRKIDPRHWFGWVGGNPCIVEESKDWVRFFAPASAAKKVACYFTVDQPLKKLLQTFPQNDPFLEQAVRQNPGLRLLRQDPWETLASFLLSSAKPIEEIEKLYARLSLLFGEVRSLAVPPPFPPPERILAAGEPALRACGVGYRARYLYRAARAVAEERISLRSLERLPTEEARAILSSLEGVGTKIADCVLLFAYGRWEVFPVDRWMERVLQHCYGVTGASRSPEKAQAFARAHFGPYAGLAQQYLFAWSRRALSPRVGQKKLVPRSRGRKKS